MLSIRLRSMGEGCGETPACGGQCPHKIEKNPPLFLIDTSSMEPLLASYHLPFEAFRDLVTDGNMVVTDYIALDGYFHQNGMESYLTTDTMTIWVSQEEDAADPLFTFLSDHDYVVRESNLYGNENGWNMPYYKKIITDHPSGAIVVINYVLPAKGDPLSLLLTHLPVSTISWWESETDQFFTGWEEMTLQKKVFVKGMGPLEDPTLIDQYSPLCQEILGYLRFFGFQICEEPCVYVEEEDTREVLKKEDPFAGMTAFDLMAYEEVGCRDHLRASPWNILLQVGDTFHAYDRRVLARMMMEKEIVARGHHFFTTPHHQSVEEYTLTLLRTSDYSVVELVHAYDATLDATRHVTSVYHVNFYSVEGWQHGTIGATVSAPLKTEVTPIEPYVPDQVEVDAALDAVLAGPAAASSAARHEAMMALYRSAEQELDRERVLMAELAESLARYMVNGVPPREE